MAPRKFKLMSPRLAGVQILSLDCTPVEYQKWRRAVRSAMTDASPDFWQHCDGSCSCPMPMPAERCSLKQEPQPQLLEERRDWVRKDRAVKLDLFLSISDDIKTDLFGVGPPLPPSAPTAKQMLDELDDRFSHYTFDDYHHAFCYFLNLHLDDFEHLDEFHNEFKSVLLEMEDFGQPLNNTQACSAYFSKLRCCQNPWVARKIKEWDTLEEHPTIESLMQEAPKWMVIKPLDIKNPADGSEDETFVGSDTEMPTADKLPVRPEALQQKLQRLQDQQLELEKQQQQEEAQEALQRQQQQQEQQQEQQQQQQPEHEEITIHASPEALYASQPPPRNPSRMSTRTVRTIASKASQDRPLPPLPHEPTVHIISQLQPPPRLQSRPHTPKSSRPTTPVLNSSRPRPVEPSVPNSSKLRPKLAELKLPSELRMPPEMMAPPQLVPRKAIPADSWSLPMQGTDMVGPPAIRVGGDGRKRSRAR